jgi:phenazine biosynthesis protein phzE
VRAALAARRADLAPFWLRLQTEGADRSPGPAGGPAQPPPHSRVLVIDAEDTFTSMLAHLLRSTGASVDVRRFDEPGLAATAAAHEGPVLLGPGPGDPRDTADPRIRVLRGLAARLLRDHRHGLLGVCLGHQLLAVELGLGIARKARPQQGGQERIDFFGRPETVGFYNSYEVRCDAVPAPEGVELSRDPATGEVHGLRGPGFASVQFHPESVLTLDGPGIVGELLASAAQTAPTGR